MTPPALKARKIRSVIYAGVLVVSGIFSPFALGLGLLLRLHASRSLDSSNSWRGIWAFALLGAALYGLMFWLFHPLTSLTLGVWLAMRAGRVSSLAWSLLLLWGYHGLLAPALSLVLEGLVKSSQAVPLAPRPVLSRPGRGRQTASMHPIGCAPPSRRKGSLACGISCLAAPAILAKSVAPGPWSWQPRSVSSKGSPRPWFPTRACGARWTV
jgi:hypothetical protein